MGYKIGLIALIIIVLIIEIFATMYLWNWLMPVICGFSQIDFIQAFGLNLLCGILSGSGAAVAKRK